MPTGDCSTCGIKDLLEAHHENQKQLLRSETSSLGRSIDKMSESFKEYRSANNERVDKIEDKVEKQGLKLSWYSGAIALLIGVPGAGYIIIRIILALSGG